MILIKNKRFYLLIFSLFCFEIFAKKIVIKAFPNGKQGLLLRDEKDLKVFIEGSGSVEAPFIIDGNGFTISGNSFVKVLNNARNIILKNIKFENIDIDYLESTAIVEIGSSQLSKVDGIILSDIKVKYRNKKFIDKDKKTQFHWINIFGDNIRVKNCIFDGKQNRLPIIHINSNFNGVVIENNTFCNVKPRKGEALEAIRIGLNNGYSDAVIRDNFFNNYYGDSETISVKADGVSVLKNTFKYTRSGVSLRYANECIVDSNFFENVTTPIRIAGKNHIISRNQIINSNTSIVIINGEPNYPMVDNLLITNNKFQKYAYLSILQLNSSQQKPMNVNFISNFINEKKITDIINFFYKNKYKSKITSKKHITYIYPL